jgi:fructose-1,6-bisphosphatase II / sedoheptulose-1,7-bisphosphatase
LRQEYAGRHRHARFGAERYTLHAPDIYMDKIAVGPGYSKNVVDLDAPADENIVNLAKAKGVKPEAITAMILDRPRHADLIGAVRKAGAAVSLITDGDVAGVIHTADPEKTGIDIYLGIGGAPEGVLAAAALHRRSDADQADARY